MNETIRQVLLGSCLFIIMIAILCLQWLGLRAIYNAKRRLIDRLERKDEERFE